MIHHPISADPGLIVFFCFITAIFGALLSNWIQLREPTDEEQKKLIKKYYSY